MNYGIALRGLSMTEVTPLQSPLRRRWLGKSLGLLLGGLHSPGKAGAVLRVGFIAGYEPFSFIGRDGRLSGFDVEVVLALLRRLDMTPQVEVARFEALRAMAVAGQLDLLGNQLLMLPENRRSFDFVRPYAALQLACVQHEDDDRDFLSLDDLLGKRLGVLRDTGIEQQARAVLGSTVQSFAHIQEALASLTRKNIDAVLEESLIADYLIERDGLPLRVGAPMTAAQQMGLAVAKGQRSLQQSLSAAVTSLVKSEEFRKISLRWFGYDVSRPRVSHVTADDV
jgi:cystine transport system substrate-binding protein